MEPVLSCTPLPTTVTMDALAAIIDDANFLQDCADA
jgi:hypothetical protein